MNTQTHDDTADILGDRAGDYQALAGLMFLQLHQDGGFERSFAVGMQSFWLRFAADLPAENKTAIEYGVLHYFFHYYGRIGEAVKAVTETLAQANTPEEHAAGMKMVERKVAEAKVFFNILQGFAK